jgi:hypothetical protein
MTAALSQTGHGIAAADATDAARPGRPCGGGFRQRTYCRSDRLALRRAVGRLRLCDDGERASAGCAFRPHRAAPNASACGDRVGRRLCPEHLGRERGQRGLARPARRLPLPPRPAVIRAPRLQY